MLTPKRVLEGLTLVAVGVILLLNTTGQLPWSVWLSVLSLWPVLLVAAGMDILARGLEANWLRVASGLLVIGGLLYGAFVLPVTSPTGGWFFAGRGAEFEDSVSSVPRVTEGRVAVKGGAGSYTMSAGPQDDFVRITGRSSFGAPILSTDIDRRSVHVDIIGPESDRVWVPGIHGPTHADIELSRDLRWSVELDTGVVNIDADLADLAITAVDVRSGVSQVALAFGPVPQGILEVPVSIRGGVANFNVRVPSGVPVRIEADAGLSNIEVDREIPRIPGERRVWQTLDYGRGVGGYNIRLEAGVSNIEVVTY